MMTFVKRPLDALWPALAKMILPDPVLRLDQLDVDPAEIEREYKELLAKQQRRTKLVAKWVWADADVSKTTELEHTPSETQRGKAALEPKGSKGQ